MQPGLADVAKLLFPKQILRQTHHVRTALVYIVDGLPFLFQLTFIVLFILIPLTGAERRRRKSSGENGAGALGDSLEAFVDVVVKNSKKKKLSAVADVFFILLC